MGGNEHTLGLGDDDESIQWLKFVSEPPLAPPTVPSFCMRTVWVTDVRIFGELGIGRRVLFDTFTKMKYSESKIVQVSVERVLMFDQSPVKCTR